jgi:hypothetical protein
MRRKVAVRGKCIVKASVSVLVHGSSNDYLLATKTRACLFLPSKYKLSTGSYNTLPAAGNDPKLPIDSRTKLRQIHLPPLSLDNPMLCEGFANEPIAFHCETGLHERFLSVLLWHSQLTSSRSRSKQCGWPQHGEARREHLTTAQSSGWEDGQIKREAQPLTVAAGCDTRVDGDTPVITRC